jgi:tRNA A-37 threonylcarbamoyl transferase component Bud32
MGLYELHGKVEFRDIKSEVAFIEKCRACSLPVPEVVMSSADWMLARYIPGPVLKDYLGTFGGSTAIPSFLGGLFRAHSSGIALGDRWGGNEIVTEPNRVTFLDFDIDVRFKGHCAKRCRLAFDLAVALRASLLWPQDKREALEHVQAWFHTLPSWSAKLYDFALLTRFLRGACRFYTPLARPASLETSGSQASHTATNIVVYRLAELLEEGQVSGQQST